MPPLRGLMEMLLLATVYFVVGKLALLLAIPPGYAAAVWPGAGIALAWVLIRGNGLWPGILLGSVLLNLMTSLDAVPSGSILGPVALSLVLGLGASLQTLLGATLVRRFVGFPNPLTHEEQIIRLLLLGGPLACLTSTTWATAALSMAGALPPAHRLFSWWTWWVGDTIGVIVFTPLVLTWTLTRRGARPMRQIYVTVPLLLTAMLSFWFFMRAGNMELERIRAHFERQTDHTAQVLRADFWDYIEVLYSITAFFESSQEVTREEFHSFTARYLLRHPGIQALEWVPVVSETEREAYEEAARRDGFPQFQVTQRETQHKMAAAGQRERYYPVYFVEPYAGNEAALGFDLGSNPTRLEALILAADTGQATATSRITLVQEEGAQPGLLVFAPINQKGTTLENAEKRREHLSGFAVGVFRVGDMMSASLHISKTDQVDVFLHDCSSPVSERLLYSSPSYVHGNRQPQAPFPAGFSPCHALDDGEHGPPATIVSPRSIPLALGGRGWVLSFVPSPEYLAANRSWQAWSVLAAGLLGTGLLGAFLLVVTGRTARIEEVVALRTEQLQRINEELQEQIAERELVERELERARDSLEMRVRERTRDLEEAQKELIHKAIEAGRAQLSAMVLHNIGNAITPVQVYMEDTRIQELEQTVHYLAEAFQELEDHRLELQTFVNEDERGKAVFFFLGKLARLLPGVVAHWTATLGKIAGAVDYISQVLSLHQAHAAREQEIKEIVSLNEIVDNAIKIQEGALKKRNIEIRCELTPQLPRLMVDKNRLIQVVVNVIKNGYEAIDEAEGNGREKRISLRTTRERDMARLVIADTGIGIAPELAPAAFDLGKSHKGSSGFGLYYCKKFVEANGGHIFITSEGHGKGTEVAITLPAAPSNTEDRP